jgi:CRISPR system Cascade subunit CasB
VEPGIKHHQAFVSSLGALVARQDRGALAALRRGLGKPPGLAPEMDRYVVPWLRGDRPWRSDESYYLLASLFAAWHQGRDAPKIEEGATPGRALRRLARRAQQQAPSIERRFTALLACHRDELFTHLRHVGSLLRAHDEPLDWAQLLTDLDRWDNPSRSVQRRWARDFWRADPNTSHESSASPVTDSAYA